MRGITPLHEFDSGRFETAAILKRLAAAGKEVLRYRQAIGVGFQAVRSSGLLTNNHIRQIQAELERNDAGFRRVPGTMLKGPRLRRCGAIQAYSAECLAC